MAFVGPKPQLKKRLHSKIYIKKDVNNVPRLVVQHKVSKMSSKMAVLPVNLEKMNYNTLIEKIFAKKKTNYKEKIDYHSG